MSDYIFKNIETLSEQEATWKFVSGVHVVLFNLTQPPPHLLILVHGAVFSISVSGPRVDWPLPELLRMVRTKKIPTMFISLKDLPSILTNHSGVKELIHDLTMVHPNVRAKEASCLFPIMEFCKTIYNIDISKVKVIFDLLDQLESVNVIDKLSHLNMEKWIEHGEFKIDRYG